MKVLASLIVFLLAIPAWADDAPPTVTVDFKDVPLRQTLDAITVQTSVPIVTSPGLKCLVNLTLQDISLEQAVTAIASAHNYRWKRVDLAVSKDSPIGAEEIARTVSLLDSLSVTGLIVADKEKKTQTVFGKGLPSAAPPQLPEGLKWQSVYLLLKPEEEKKDEDGESASEEAEEAKTRIDYLNEERLDLLMGLSPEERQKLAQEEFNRMLTVAPELRRDVLRGWAAAVMHMDPQMRRDFGTEMRDSLSDMFGGQGRR